MAYAKTIDERKKQFPDNWDQFRFAKSNQFDKLIKECVECYLREPMLSLDQIADELGLPDRRTVASYLSKAKRAIKERSESLQAGLSRF